MSDAQEDENAKEDHDPPRHARRPSKKRLEDEVDAVMAEIREKETELKNITTNSVDFRSIRAEKDEIIERRKKVDADLKILNQVITQKMTALSKLQSSLCYRREDKHNDAIRKLEWNLKVQNFKLSQEKKIVAEIDSLKRSKKMLGQYLAMKKEIDEIRDKQRLMREERDHYFKSLKTIKAKEDENRKKNFMNKTQAEALKTEINELYEKKRGMVNEFRKQKEVFSDKMKRQRAQSFRKREEERQAKLEAEQKEYKELEAQKEPYEDEQNLCNMLISYLQKLYPGEETSDAGNSTTTDGNSTTTDGQNSQDSLTLDNEEGYRLLRKSEDLEEFPALSRRSNKNKRRSRRLSMTKPVTHTPHVISQFSSLNLNAPTSVAEIPASLEQLQGRKLYYEKKAKELNLTIDSQASKLDKSDRSLTWGFLGEQEPIPEESSQSEAGVSYTESMMSRQDSKTESCDSVTDSRPIETVLDELLRPCCKDNYGNPDKASFTEIDSHSLSDSESTLEGSNGESLGSGNDFDVRFEAGRLDTHQHSAQNTLCEDKDKSQVDSTSDMVKSTSCDTEKSNETSCDKTLDTPWDSVPCDTPTLTDDCTKLECIPDQCAETGSKASDQSVEYKLSSIPDQCAETGSKASDQSVEYKLSSIAGHK